MDYLTTRIFRFLMTRVAVLEIFEILEILSFLQVPGLLLRRSLLFRVTSRRAGWLLIRARHYTMFLPC